MSIIISAALNPDINVLRYLFDEFRIELSHEDLFGDFSPFKSVLQYEQRYYTGRDTRFSPLTENLLANTLPMIRVNSTSQFNPIKYILSLDGIRESTKISLMDLFASVGFKVSDDQILTDILIGEPEDSPSNRSLLPLIEYVCAIGADINSVGGSGNTALHIAVIRGDFELVKFIVEKMGARTDIQNTENMTPLDLENCTGTIKDYLLDLRKISEQESQPGSSKDDNPTTTKTPKKILHKYAERLSARNGEDPTSSPNLTHKK